MNKNDANTQLIMAAKSHLLAKDKPSTQTIRLALIGDFGCSKSQANNAIKDARKSLKIHNGNK